MSQDSDTDLLYRAEQLWFLNDTSDVQELWQYRSITFYILLSIIWIWQRLDLKHLKNHYVNYNCRMSDQLCRVMTESTPNYSKESLQTSQFAQVVHVCVHIVNISLEIDCPRQPATPPPGPGELLAVIRRFQRCSRTCTNAEIFNGFGQIKKTTRVITENVNHRKKSNFIKYWKWKANIFSFYFPEEIRIHFFFTSSILLLFLAGK